MGSGGWLRLDQLLRFVDYLLAPASLIELLVARVKGGRRRGLVALALAGTLAISVAQPFGVKAVPISPDRYAAGNPEPAEAEQIQRRGCLRHGDRRTSAGPGPRERSVDLQRV